jgi:hypothetical protein
MKRLIGLVFVIGICGMLLVGPSAVYAGEKEGVKVGTLEVATVAGSGRNLLITSHIGVKAVFTDTEGNKEYYVGETGVRLGVDLSIRENEKLYYYAFSPAGDYRTGSYAMAGKYFGTKYSAGVVVGGGVQFLIGGSKKSFTLQPFSVTVHEGYGVTYGMGYLYLQKDPEH